MLIAQITDLHIGFEPNSPDEPNMQRLRAVLRRLVDGPNRPDLLLMTGDLTEAGTPESYALLADAVHGCPFPVLAMAGNHDARPALLEAFPDTPSQAGFVHGAIDLPGLRVVILDTLEPGRHGGAFCEARVAWLRETLAGDLATPTLIAMHHPPFESGIAWLDSVEAEPWIGRFAQAVTGFPQIRAIMAGHLHRTIHTVWNGIALTVCPSTAPAVALDLRPIDAEQPDGRVLISAEPPAYALHRWDGRRLVTHFESAEPHGVLARFDAALQPMVRGMMAERPS